MIFLFLFIGIALSLLAADAGNRLAAFAAMVCAAISLLAGVISGQVGVPTFLAGVFLLADVLFLIHIWKFCHSGYALIQQPDVLKLHYALASLGAIVALLLGMHVFAGEPRFRALSDVVISSRFPTPLNIDGSYGKGLAGLAVLLILGSFSGFMPNRVRLRNWWQVPVLSAAAILVAIALFSLPLDPKFPDVWWRFVLSNLLLTCVAEEAFFRGLLYKFAADAFDRVLPGYSALAAILITAVLFTAVHAGSLDYLFMVFVVGCVSGWARHATGSISAAVATHAIINGIHFFVLKYPFS